MGLEIYLSPKSGVSSIGPERGPNKPPANGIVLYTCPYGSYRYVAYVAGEAVSAYQVMSRDGITGQAANAYTVPSFRRKGWATKLHNRALRDFSGGIQPATDLSADGAAWTKAVQKQALVGRLLKVVAAIAK